MPLRAGDDSGIFREKFEKGVLTRLSAFAPDLIVISAGFDAHRLDPLASVELDEADFGWATRKLMEIMEEEAENGNYVIAGGDFNQSFSNTDISAYPLQEGKWAPGSIDTADFSDGWQCAMDSTVPTCRSLDQPLEGADKSTFQYYVIDGFIVSSNIEIRSLKTQDLGFVYTDHNPVLMECALK